MKGEYQMINFGLESNEAKEQRIIRLRTMFQKQEIVTITSAEKKTGFSRATIIKWCKQGNIPLWDDKKNKSVVELTKQNTPKWLQK